ncbi:MAG: gamma-glutamylcyclotransferase [Rhodospirillaceae bacterium]|nr:gamma-glutamylcyclotransferase [Rhodospirillaceae bacterium]MYF85797.1 gamma-glutamylcyclotransferase [Rhodospirillaceae bacterium]MYH37123.1 gamma-glutamylcyclotransferase [Rhodospirillaceae bacterium]MYK14409.1 gamma-glutamylcyclotransferase [Rhodospirillaceae bacterium]MYK60080.1 gamma-glutamylcyclotransferase [Rhodospirillaceae bacterium]
MWLFGYGSLMWRPGFDYAERRRATLHGRQRALCVRTVHHRGTAARPGLVMGLKPGGSCTGIAYRIAAEDAEAVAAYLRKRELDHYPVYRESAVAVELDDGRQVSATTYLPRAGHPDFLPDLGTEEQLAIVRQAEGVSGSNADYVRSAARALRELGIDEPAIFAAEAALKGRADSIDIPDDAGRLPG